MKIYRNTDVELQGCQSTIAVLQKIKDVIVAMTSRSSQNSLKPGSASLKVRINFKIIKI